MATLPPPSPDQTYVTISPISGGHLTLPDSAFVSLADPNAKRYVPSLSFLVTHPGKFSTADHISLPSSGSPLRILFDLGLRHRIDRYTPPQQKHLESRSPYHTQPGIAEILEQHGVSRKEINVITYSHVHYDHHGDPEDFPNAQFRVGSGSLNVLAHGLSAGMGTHQHFDPNLLPQDRTREFPSATQEDGWKRLGPFEHTLDLLGDGSVYVVDTPGHLPGHVNLLCRTGPGKWVCLCGDAYHDPRLLSGEKDIGTWEGENGRVLCIHVYKETAEESIKRLRELKNMGGVELIAAHDEEWCARNEGRFFPNCL
jgi:glyoxylase-like metal-dependent hydrolase (beta-lactamase superfamily II)